MAYKKIERNDHNEKIPKDTRYPGTADAPEWMCSKLEKICLALDCKVEDILELQPEEQQELEENGAEDISQKYEMEMIL